MQHRIKQLGFILEVPIDRALGKPGRTFGDRTTPRAENVLPPKLQTPFNIPTNGKPSPLFGAEPFTQQLLLFEEFGSEKLDPATPPQKLTFPVTQ